MSFPVIDDLDGTYIGFYRDQLVTNEDASVDYESRTALVGEVFHLQLVRTVTRRARYRKDQITLWSEVVLSVPREKTGELVRDLVDEAVSR